MIVTSEMLAAYADGELDDLAAARVQRAVAADPALAAELARLSALRSLLSKRFDPVLAQPVPARLTAPIADAAKVVDLGADRAARQRLWTRSGMRPGMRPGMRIAAGSAIAASLALLLVFVGRGGSPAGYADAQLAAALDGTFSGQSAGDGTRVLLSFRDAAGAYCRGFAGPGRRGIACHEAQGWKVRQIMPENGASPGASGAYRQAGSADGAIMAAAQDMAAGPALDLAEEQAARAAGWIGAR